MYYMKRCMLVLLGICGSLIALVLLMGNSRGGAMPQARQGAVAFPYRVDNTPLVILDVVAYEGPYVELDDDEVVDVAALLVKNDSSQTIAQARVVVKGSERDYYFCLSYLPAGESLMVLADKKAQWVSQEILGCYGEYSYGEKKENPLQIVYAGKGNVLLTNPTDETIKNVFIYHKNWSDEAGMYMGGIAYKTHILRLRPGQTILLKPYHFVPGVSKVVHIELQRAVPL